MTKWLAGVFLAVQVLAGCAGGQGQFGGGGFGFSGGSPKFVIDKDLHQYDYPSPSDWCSKSKTAETLGISLKTLYNRLQGYRVEDFARRTA